MRHPRLMSNRELQRLADLSLPPHGPGCLPTIGRSTRFPGEPRYICTATCPRASALARRDAKGV